MGPAMAAGPGPVRARRTFATLALTSLIIGCNWMIYIHAMDSDQVLESSLGYFINPLVNILFGRVFLSERLSRTQALLRDKPLMCLRSSQRQRRLAITG